MEVKNCKYKTLIESLKILGVNFESYIYEIESALEYQLTSYQSDHPDIDIVDSEYYKKVYSAYKEIKDNFKDFEIIIEEIAFYCDNFLKIMSFLLMKMNEKDNAEWIAGKVDNTFIDELSVYDSNTHQFMRSFKTEPIMFFVRSNNLEDLKNVFDIMSRRIASLKKSFFTEKEIPNGFNEEVLKLIELLVSKGDLLWFAMQPRYEQSQLIDIIHMVVDKYGIEEEMNLFIEKLKNEEQLPEARVKVKGKWIFYR